MDRHYWIPTNVSLKRNLWKNVLFSHKKFKCKFYKSGIWKNDTRKSISHVKKMIFFYLERGARGIEINWKFWRKEKGEKKETNCKKFFKFGYDFVDLQNVQYSWLNPEILLIFFRRFCVKIVSFFDWIENE